MWAKAGGDLGFFAVDIHINIENIEQNKTYKQYAKHIDDIYKK